MQSHTLIFVLIGFCHAEPPTANDKPVVVRHKVAFSYSANAPADEAKKFEDAMKNLPSEIPEILTYKFSKLTAIDKASEGKVFNVVAESGFASNDDYLSYRANPAHSQLCPTFRQYLTSRAALETYDKMPDDFDTPQMRVYLFPKLQDGLPKELLSNITKQLRDLGTGLAPGSTSVAIGQDLGNTPAAHQWNANEFVIEASFSLGTKNPATDPAAWTSAREILKPYLEHSNETYGTPTTQYYISVKLPEANEPTIFA